MSTNRQHMTATIFDKRGRVLSVGKNSYYKTHPEMARLGKRVDMPEKIFLHAEISALIRCNSKNAYKIKIERYNKKGVPLLAKPCAICELAIREAGIKFIEYTFN